MYAISLKGINNIIIKTKWVHSSLNKLNTFSKNNGDDIIKNMFFKNVLKILKL